MTFRNDPGVHLSGSCNLWPRFFANAIQCLVQAVCTLAQAFAFFVRHFRLEHLGHALAADNAWQRQGHSKLRLVTSDRDDRALVAQHHLGDTRRYDADAGLADIMALDDCDVSIADVTLELVPQLVNPLAAPREQCRDRNATDSCGGPEKSLRRPVVANDLGFGRFSKRTRGPGLRLISMMLSRKLWPSSATTCRHIGSPFKPTLTNGCRGLEANRFSSSKC